MLKIKVLSFILMICLVIGTVMPIAFAEEETPIEATKLGALQVGEYKEINLCNAKADEKTEVTGKLPDGMEIKNQAATETQAALWLIAGTPTVSGTFDFSVKYYDDTNTEGTVINYTVSVYDRIFPEGTVCSPYAKSIVSDNSKKFICKLIDGELPEGFVIANMNEGEGSQGPSSSSWTLRGNCLKSGEFAFDIEIKTVNSTSSDFAGETTEIIKCYLKINDKEVPKANGCALYEDFEDELTGWTCEGFERTETEDAYEGKYAMKATSKATLKMPVFQARNSSEFVFHVSIPEGEELKVNTLRCAEADKIDELGIEHNITVCGKGEWRTELISLTESYYSIEFCYDGEGEVMIDLVSATLGYDEYKTLPKVYAGIEFSKEFDGWFNNHEYKISGEIPEGVTITKLTSAGQLTKFKISGTAKEAGSISFEIVYSDAEGKIEYVEKYSMLVLDFMIGDLTGDGVVNTGDAVVVLRYAAEMIQLTPVQEKSGDMNGDGVVNTADAVSILKKCAEN